MKNNNGDIQIREKIASVDTLSSGIVFGKEDAWDKLQARLDKKPNRRHLYLYWSAAAVLLLLAGIWMGYRNTGKENVVVVKQKTDVHAPVADAHQAEKKQDVIPANVLPAHKLVKHVAATKQINRAIPVAIKEEVQRPIVATVEVPRQISVEAVTPRIQEPIAMKIVHINEMEGRIPHSSGTATAINTLPVDVSALPVSHLNDAVRQAEEIKEIRKGTRMVFRSRASFLDPEKEAVRNDNTSSPLFLKNIFNAQN